MESKLHPADGSFFPDRFPRILFRSSPKNLNKMDRLKQLAGQFSTPSGGKAALLKKSPDDVVITMAIRSPLCKAGKGSYKDTRYPLVSLQVVVRFH